MSEGFDLGQKLKETREKAGLSQKELADRLEVKPPVVNKAERSANTSLAFFTRAVKAMGYRVRLEVVKERA